MEATIKPYTTKLNSLYLGRQIGDDLGLRTGESYPIAVTGVDIADLRGAFSVNYTLSALAPMYSAYDLQDGDKVVVSIREGTIYLEPPATRARGTATPVSSPATGSTTPQPPIRVSTVFARKSLRHLHIEAFSPGNLARWTPRTEADVYMVFGALSEYTKYRYCCGASSSLLDQLGYSAPNKPDAILIDRTSQEYLIGEVKMKSSDFSTNHDKEDVDVLICWEDNAKVGREKLPDQIVSLKDILKTAIEANEIEL